MIWFRRLLVATIAWGVLAFGGVYPWAYWPLAAATAGLGGWALARAGFWHDPRARAIAAMLGVVAVAIGVQIVPLPYALVNRLSPGVDAYLREYLLGYRPPVTHALSIAPAFTAVALALYVALAVLLVGLMRVLRDVRLDWLMTQIMGLGIALAVVGVVQKALLDPENPLVYGFWRPQYLGSPFGPFVNRNHFAGWMLMALPLVVGYACAVFQRTERPRAGTWRMWLRWATTVDANRFVLTVFAALTMGMSLVLTGSRSGVAGLAVVVAALAAVMVRRVTGLRMRVAAGTAMTAVLAIAILWAGVGRTVARFALAPVELEGRFAAWRDSWEIIKDFPLFGTGVATYGRAMLVYQTTGREEIYLQAHNDYIQLAAEGGLLVGIPVILLCALLARTIWRRMTADDDTGHTAWIRAGAMAGLLGIAAQSLVEFSLQMPGNALMFVLLVAIAIHRPARSTGAYRV